MALTQSASTQDVAVLRLLEQAEQLERRGETDAMLDTYAQVVDQFPDDERAPAALLRLAQGRWARGESDAAMDAATRLRGTYADAPSAAGAYVLEGTMLLASATNVDELREARTVFGRVPALFDRARYPDGRWRREARMQHGRVSVLLGELDMAAGDFLSVVEDELAAPDTAEARVQFARVLFYQRRWLDGLDTLQDVVSQAGAAARADTAPASTARARRRLSLVHRTVLRPALGVPPWSTVRRLQAPGRGWRDPIGVAVSDDGRVLVSDEGNDQTLLFDAAGERLATSATDDARLPWWGNDATPYALTRRGALRPLDSRGATVFEVPDGNDMEPLEDLRAGGRGPLFDWTLLDTDRREVVRFDRAGGYQRTLMDRRRDRNVVDLHVDARGRLWLLDREQDQVLRLALDATDADTVVSRDWRRPEALTTDAVGHLYVLDRDAKTVDMFDQDGAHMLSLGPVLSDGTELRSPRDIAVDGAGRLYIADRDLDTVLILE